MWILFQLVIIFALAGLATILLGRAWFGLFEADVFRRDKRYKTGYKKVGSVVRPATKPEVFAQAVTGGAIVIGLIYWSGLLLFQGFGPIIERNDRTKVQEEFVSLIRDIDLKNPEETLKKYNYDRGRFEKAINGKVIRELANGGQKLSFTNFSAVVKNLHHEPDRLTVRLRLRGTDFEFVGEITDLHRIAMLQSIEEGDTVMISGTLIEIVILNIMGDPVLRSPAKATILTMEPEKK